MKKLLTVREVSDLLRLNERTVLKMLQAGELPGIRIGSQWRIHPVLLEDWFLRRSSTAPVGPEAAPPLFREELVALDVPAGDRDAVLGALVGRLVAGGHLLYPDLFLQAVREREQMLSTGIGHGVAVPHARHAVNELFVHPSIVFARTAAPVPYAAVDGRPVDLFFLLAVPTADHLSTVARVSRLARDAALLGALRAAATPAAAVAALLSVEAAPA